MVSAAFRADDTNVDCPLDLGSRLRTTATAYGGRGSASDVYGNPRRTFFAWSFTRPRPRPRYSARDVALRKQARMRLHVQVRIAAAMSRVVDLLAWHQLVGDGLCFCRTGRCGRSGAWAHGRATCEKRDEKRDEQHDEARRADRQAIHLANGWKSRDGLVRGRDSRGERCACQRPDRISVAMRPTCPPLVDCMFRFDPVACMTRT